MMTRNTYKMVLLSEDPHFLFSRVRFFGRLRKNVRVEAVMRFPEVHAQIFPAEGLSAKESGKAAAAASRQLRKVFRRYLVSDNGRTLGQRFVGVLARHRMTFACAESCSGGMIASLVTSVPGSSEVFLAGIVSYGNEAKFSLLGVEKQALKKYGAVSGQVVEEMLAGIMSKTGARCAAATSGIAGPTGGSRRKPVGLVYIGAAVGSRRAVRKVMLQGMERSEIKHLSAALAMKLLLDLLESKP
jgi:nicotinamide-nucleotide amidase